MDFVVRLPAFRGNTVTMVVTDRFSKAVHLRMLLTHFMACKAAELFTSMICELHEYPKSIISDRDYFPEQILASII